MNFRVISDKLSSLMLGHPLPYFRVRLEGRGIALPIDDDTAVIGFITTRVVRANSEIDAAAAAKGMIREDWSNGDYASANKGGFPIITIEWTRRDAFLDALRFKNGGYTFYCSDDDSPEDIAVDV